MKSLLLACFLFLECPLVFASEKNNCKDCSFIGIVVDAITKKPLANVIVIAKLIDSNEGLKAVTDESGQYQIPALPTGIYTLRFENDNYRTVERKNLAVRKNTARLNIELLTTEALQEDHHNWLMKFDIR